MRRFLFLLIFGLGGAGILIWLGVWQVQRLAWKEGMLAQIESRISDAPVALPDTFDPAQDRYMPVATQGAFDGATLRVLISVKREGPGYRLITPFVTTDARRILVDRGWIGVEAPLPPLPQGRVRVVGNLHWPDEIDSFTPEPDKAGNPWFAREVSVMAEELETEPVLLVVREASYPDLGVTPLPVDTAGIPNDHLQYAITWFSLAFIWLGMTAFFTMRSSRVATQRP